MKYRVYEVNLVDEAMLQCVFEGNEEGYQKAKQMRTLLYNLQEKNAEEGIQREMMRYIIICD